MNDYKTGKNRMSCGIDKTEIEKIADTMKVHKPDIIGINRCRHSAVCIPVINGDEGPSLLFQKRSSKIPHQPGDICFPGGMIDPGETPIQAAVREICEELLISESQVKVLGESDYVHMEHLAVYPFVVELVDYENTFSRDEVEEVFTVPLAWLRENKPEVYKLENDLRPQEGFPYERIVGGRNYQWRSRSEKVYFYQYGEYAIWGLTAKILKSFLEICG